MQLTIRLLRETDGRWIGDVPELPGVTVYGATSEEASSAATTDQAAPAPEAVSSASTEESSPYERLSSERMRAINSRMR